MRQRQRSQRSWIQMEQPSSCRRVTTQIRCGAIYLVVFKAFEGRIAVKNIMHVWNCCIKSWRYITPMWHINTLSIWLVILFLQTMHYTVTKYTIHNCGGSCDILLHMCMLWSNKMHPGKTESRFERRGKGFECRYTESDESYPRATIGHQSGCDWAWQHTVPTIPTVELRLADLADL